MSEQAGYVPVVGAVAEPQPAPEKSYRFSDQAIQELEEILTHYPDKKSAILPALWIAQREYEGYLPPQAIQEVADRLERPYVEVEGVATFYTMYNLRKRGRHHLEVCTCLTCAVMGAYEVVHHLEKRLGVKVGQTTADGEFTLSEVECLNYCGAATVVQVGDKYFGNITKENVDALIEMLRSSNEFTPADLANAVVKLHIPERAAKR
jgi:NADH-quinone oxidoreductase E subunit